VQKFPLEKFSKFIGASWMIQTVVREIPASHPVFVIGVLQSSTIWVSQQKQIQLKWNSDRVFKTFYIQENDCRCSTVVFCRAPKKADSGLYAYSEEQFRKTVSQSQLWRLSLNWKFSSMAMLRQARRQDLAPGRAKNQMEGPKNSRGHIFKIQYWMYAATGGPNVKWGEPISNGGAGHHWPPASDGPVLTSLTQCSCDTKK